MRYHHSRSACDRSITGLANVIRACRGLHPDKVLSKKKGDAFLDAVADTQLDLDGIDLMDCDAVTDAGLANLIAKTNLRPDQVKSAAKGPLFCAAVAQHRQDLVEIQLEQCRAIQDEALASLVKGCPNLLPERIYSSYKGDTFCASVATVHGADLTSLDLAGCNAVTNAGLELLVKKCTQLSDLVIRSCKNVTETGFTLLAKSCKQLARLDLLYCTKVTDAVVGMFIEECSKLRPDTLISNCKGDKFCQAVAKQHTDLDFINLQKGGATDNGLTLLIEGCKSLHPDKIVSLQKGDKFCAAVAKHRPDLTSINLSGCKMTDVGLALLLECPELPPDAIVAPGIKGDMFCASVAKYRPDLSSINLKDGTQVTDVGLSSLVDGCKQLDPKSVVAATPVQGDLWCAAVARQHPELTSIDLRSYPAVTDVGLASLQRGCPKLLPSSIFSSAMGNDWCAAVAEIHPNLTEIDLRQCNKVGDTGLAMLVDGCPNLLPSKILSHAKGDRFCAAVARRHPGVTSLDLSGCAGLSNSGIETLAFTCTQLTKLDVTGCPTAVYFLSRLKKYVCNSVKSKHLGSLSGSYPVYEIQGDWARLDESSAAWAQFPKQSGSQGTFTLKSKQVSDEGLSQLIEQCPKLLPQNLASVALGNQCCSAIAKSHPNLTELDLRHCHSVTDRGLAWLITGCRQLVPNKLLSTKKGDLFCAAVAKHRPELTTLDLQNCEAVTDGGLNLLARSLAGLTRINLVGCTSVTDEGLALLVRCPQLAPSDVLSAAKGRRFCATVAKRRPDLTEVLLPDLDDVIKKMPRPRRPGDVYDPFVVQMEGLPRASMTKQKLQLLYDNEEGEDAPDTVPQEVKDVARSFPSVFVVYLGHNTWWFRNSSATSNFSRFSNNKKNFSYNTGAIFTYKRKKIIGEFANMTHAFCWVAIM